VKLFKKYSHFLVAAQHCFLFLISPSLFAFDVAKISNGSLVGKEFSIFVDKTSSHTIQSITQDGSISFEKSKTESLNFGHSDYTYWLKLPLTNNSSEIRSLFLLVDYNNIDEFEFFSPLPKEQSDGYHREKIGMKYPFDVRNVKNRNFIFPIELLPGESKTYYFCSKTVGGHLLPLRLWEKEEFYAHDSNQLQGLGFYFGIMFVMLVYNFFIFISVKDVSYLYYIGYIFGLSGIQLVITGLGYQNFWPSYPWLQQNLYVIFSTICMGMSLLFAKSFLNIREISRKVDWLMSLMIGLNILILFSIFLFPRSVTIMSAIIGSVPSILLAILAGIISYLNHYRPARYYLLAFSMLILMSLFVIMKFLNLMEANFFTEYGLYLGSCLEVVLLSFALASRINTIKREKEEAQTKSLEIQKLLTESYARFVPRDFLSNLGKESILDVRLGDQIQKEMSVLFSDIRSFTTLSEKMTPAENFNFINSYLSRMSPIIQRNRGFIDKFIGDAVMALFDKSVLDAVKAGVEMQHYLKDYNSFRKNRGYDPIEIGVGIHTGSLMLGTIGAEERLEGTVISDTVNLASRIENLTKVYGSKIAVSEEIIQEVKRDGVYSFRFLDRVKVKGKMKSVSIYEILDGEEPSSKIAKQETKENFDIAVRMFHDKEFQDSEKYFQLVIKQNPNDKVSQLYLKRLYAAENRIGYPSEALISSEE